MTEEFDVNITTPVGQELALDRVLASFDDEEREAFARWLLGNEGTTIRAAECRDGNGEPCRHDVPCMTTAIRADLCRDAEGTLWLLGDPSLPVGTELTPIGRHDGRTGGTFLVEEQ